MRKLKTILAATALSVLSSTAYADGHAANWTLDPAVSNVSFGSIKNDYAGESHSFGKVSGTVSAEGLATIELGLGSVQTNIDIRNERLMEFVFDNAPSATITAQLDMVALMALGVAETTTVETTGTLTLLGTETELDAVFFVMRLSEDKVLVTTDGMLMLSTEDAGLDDGISKLQELASLDSITRVSPVTMRLIFDAGS
ncbi:YceI family protein [Sulfitobacter sp. SK012]|uniref:YceI family protein n=1 Tax=Sulfitobacter sp. SK012 TaxID=1389005 RepID=UPI000E0C2656|nr:YceI family protein [Sulfitobacter sp. SK012]AXI46746.1 YceI family protein [Sulfitobacter sp. SK012]